MRFAELHLIRYGQFEDCRLDFPNAPADLHVVYGPNEAGKSTTMAAIADLLFGFPHAVGYDFRFDKLLLRVGGVIEGGASPLICRRKRGNVRTLMDEGEQPIDEASLAGLLAGQTRESFHRAFSLDHTRLREGGQSMLEAKDDIGQAIFAAGSGLVGVTRIVDTLEEEAKAIWGERAAANRLYYIAQKAHDEAKARLRESQLKSAHWAELKKILEGHERELETLRGQRAEVQAALQATERRRRVLAPAAARRHRLTQLDALGSIPDLPADAATVLEQASRQILESGATERLALQQAESARGQLAELTFEASLLGHRARATSLRGQLGAVEKALADAPGLKTKVAVADDQLKRLLQEVGWPEAAAREVRQRLPGRPQISELRDLLEEHTALQAARSSALDGIRDQAALVSDLRGQLDAQPSLEIAAGFIAVLQGVRGQGDMEAAARAAEARRQKARAALDGALASLAPWQGSEAELATLALVSEAETYRLGEALGAAEDELAGAQSALVSLEEERAHRELRRTHLMRHQHAISWEMLEAARRTRDTTWSEFSAHLGGEASLETLSDTQERFSRELREADDLADRRFDAAETSAALLRLDQDLESTDLSIAQAKSRIATAETGLTDAMAAWRAATLPVGPEISPDGLRAWRIARVRALELAGTEKVEATEAARLAKALNDARRQLLNLLPSDVAQRLADASLATLVQAADEVETAADEVGDQRAALEVRVEAAEEARRRAEDRRDEADRQLEGWGARWAAAVDAAKINAEGSLSLVRTRLDLIDEVRTLAGTILGFEQRIEDIARDVAAFSAQVRSLAEEFSLQGGEGDDAHVLAAIEQQLAKIATLADRAEGLRTQEKDAEGRVAEAREAAELARAALAPLLSAAKVEEPAELRAVIDRVEAAKTLKAEIEELVRSILELGDGLSLEALLADTADADAIELTAESERLQEALRSLSSEIERVAELRQAAYLEFKQADDRPDAAIAAADLAQARAEMEAQAEAYVRKRSEATLLRWTVERYRREKQAPLLKRASAIFSELTLGKYGSLDVDVEGGRPRLSGISADGGTVVPVTGMSEGTVDQLFLSLRLAAVEESVAAGVRLPFLADDLFINYDDGRSAAGFRVLARLAEQTQVLFFTHHEHLAALARDTLGGGIGASRLGDRIAEAAQ